MLNDLASFIARCRGEWRGRFTGPGPVRVARAPGRLDAFGGIIDYTGGTVCEMPLAVAAKVALGRRTDRRLRFFSDGIDDHGLAPIVELSLDDLFDGVAARPYDEVRQRLGERADAAWARYLAGAWLVLVAEGECPAIEHGADVVLESSVPLGAGVSSSAAIEVAMLAALTADLGLSLPGTRLARLGQIVENHVVGAPCGLMDQLTSTLGEADAMLVIRCQPDQILAKAKLPDGIGFAAIDTGVKHSVAGGQYTAARVAAFMGHRIIIERAAGAGWCKPGEDPFDGYLARVPLREYELVYRRQLPATMAGRDFLAEYGGTVDTATRVDPDRVYDVAAATAHHVLDNARAPRLVKLLDACRTAPETALLVEAGQLLLASHASYRDQVGLGAPEADLMVELAMGYGPEQGVFGAKITGGGCGGSVAILGDHRLPDLLPLIAGEYARRTGLTPRTLTGSSPGALACGVQEIVW